MELVNLGKNGARDQGLPLKDAPGLAAVAACPAAGCAT